MATFLSIFLVIQDVYLTWVVNNVPVIGLLIFSIWLGWSSRDALAKLENRITRLENNFQTLVTVLREKKLIKTNTLERNSPLEITALGMMLLYDIGASYYLILNIDNLIDELEKTKPKCALDVEMSSVNLCYRRSTTDDGFLPIKNYIYLTPKYINTESPKDKPIELNLLLVTHIMGIYLRNRFLEKHPELLPGKKKG